VWRSQSFVAPNGAGGVDAPAAAYLPANRCAALLRDSTAVALLGTVGDVAHFALDLSHLEAPEDVSLLCGHGRFVDLRSVGPLLGRDEGALLAYARGLCHWHARHRFCGVCGSATESADAGHVRRCTSDDCATVHF